MKQFSRFRLIAAALALTTLIACDNAEDRAEGHYQRGLVLLESGEDEKAILEFRNALKLNQDALEPRLELARLKLKLGLKGVVGDYLKVIELDPNHLEARMTVARLLLGFNEPNPASEHIKVAVRVAPEDKEVRALQAVLAQKQERFEEAAGFANALLADDPGNPVAASVLVQQRMAEEDFSGAITVLDQVMSSNNQELTLHVAKLQALEGLNDQAAIGAQLEQMAAIFPDNPQVVQGRVQWFLNQGDTSSAISAQKELARLFPEDPAYALEVVRLLGQFDGAQAARAELETLAASGQHVIVFNRALADFEFQQNNPQAAIAGLKSLLETEMSEAETHDIQTQMANFMRQSGDKAGALEVALAVLKADTDNVEGLKLKALDAIDNDRPHDAITDLRAALSVSGQDPSVLLLLALAHERNGSVGLAQERLALAVQSSDAGVEESLRYAEFLTRQGKPDIAIDALEDAIDKRGMLPNLLAGLGQVQVATSEWNGALGTVGRLKQLNNPVAQVLARELEAAIFSGEQKFEQSIGVLREMWDVAGERTSAMENLVRNYIQAGQTDEATVFLEDIMKDDPKNLRANLLLGALFAYKGELEQAEAQYRKVIEDHPNVENGYGALASLLSGQGRIDEADAIIKDGINNAENTERLLFSRAGRLEQEGDYEGAIAIYEQLYEANKVSDVLANNLASLLSEFRSDPESLERAFNIAKRLRSSEEPAFQDTYGWILYKRGEYERALQPLTAAAEGARSNVFVQYHLGMVYEKLGKQELAIEQLERALTLGEGMTLPILENAREALDGLKGG